MLDTVLFGDVYPWDYVILILVAVMASGVIYGARKKSSRVVELGVYNAYFQ